MSNLLTLTTLAPLPTRMCFFHKSPKQCLVLKASATKSHPAGSSGCSDMRRNSSEPTQNRSVYSCRTFIFWTNSAVGAGIRYSYTHTNTHSHMHINFAQLSTTVLGYGRNWWIGWHLALKHKNRLPNTFRTEICCYNCARWMGHPSIEVPESNGTRLKGIRPAYE